ncbi:MAG: phenylacetate--CoA ligase family protein [Deltaproteobacteria bacterium]|jgi:phenylacetate-coenzyme A ligase PaaK-like adenylate-forming protein|nr:phenylacetate--CoA ligase family protein [Deltaproteobacteria bacterium]MBW2537381.1 phenylacetate--CoA ligase family protein [Deltaproteobacteria bacterium]
MALWKMARSWLAPATLRDVTGMVQSIATARLPRSVIERLQQRRLRTLLRHAGSRSPFYRELYGRIGGSAGSLESAPLDALPVVTKTDLLTNADRLGTEPMLRGERWGDLVESATDDGPSRAPFEVIHTSGSTSDVLHWIYDRRAWEIARAVALTRVYRPPAFMHRPTRVAYYGGTRGRLGGVRFASASPEGLVEFLPLDVHDPFEQVLTSVEAFAPDVLGGYPSAVELLAEAQVAGRVHLRPKRVITSAEPLTLEARTRIHDAFGLRPTDFYASTESLILGASCDQESGIHLFSDWHLFEVIDRDGRFVAPGEQGSLVMTNLYNRAMPLLRYQLGDEVTLASDPCPCGSPFPLIERVVGRSEEMLWLETNEGGEDFLHPVLMVDLGGDGIERVKVVQQSQRALEIRFVAKANEAAAARTLRRQIEPRLASKSMDRSVQVAIVAVDELRPDPRTGKYRFIEALPHPDGRP